jgi:hypothetical protein
MIYHVPSWTGWMLYLVHGLARGRPWTTTRKAIFEHLESPGTKAYTLEGARALVSESGFRGIELTTKLGPGDTLSILPSARYRTRLLRFLWRTYPRWLVRRLGDRFGLYLLIHARKPAGAGG